MNIIAQLEKEQVAVVAAQRAVKAVIDPWR